MQNNDSNRPDDVKRESVRKENDQTKQFLNDVGKGILKSVLVWAIAGFFTRQIGKLFRK